MIGRKGSFGRLQYSPVPVFAIDTTYFVDTTSTNADLRWLFYALSALGLDQLSEDVGVPGLSREKAYEQPLLVPSRAEQRAIANFLDAETARIDALIAKKRRMIELLTERLSAALLGAIFSGGGRETSLGHAVDLLPGYAFPSDSFHSVGEGGVRLLRGINVVPGRLRWDETVYLSAADAAVHRRFFLVVGDLVIGMDRPLVSDGMRVARVAEADVPCLLVQRVARIRATARADVDYIRFALRSSAFQAHFSPILTGVSVPHISPDQITAFRLPVPRIEVQRAIAKSLLALEGTVETTTAALTRQIALLAEHRQALITSAVTGQLDVAATA